MPHNIENYKSSLDTTVHCAYECEHCADECYSEPKMAECSRLARDAADICWSIAGFMSRGSRLIQFKSKCKAREMSVNFSHLFYPKKLTASILALLF